MSIVISEELVLEVTSGELDNPSIGYINYVTTANILAINPNDDSDVEDVDHPTINLANPSTYLYFEQDTAGEDVAFDVTLAGDKLVDYVGLAGHNLGSGSRIVTVYAATTVDQYGVPNYVQMTNAAMFGNDQPLMFRFTADYYVAVRVIMASSSGTDTMRCAVMYVGKLTVSERKLQVAFTPITMGRRRMVTNNRGEAGSFLGRLMIGQFVECSALIAFMTPDFFREEFDPFLNAAGITPFFFAWAPTSYPLEVGYAWLMDDPTPEIHDPIGLMRVTLNMQGIVE